MTQYDSKNDGQQVYSTSMVEQVSSTFRKFKLWQKQRHRISAQMSPQTELGIFIATVQSLKPR
jgi:hypothetical protein